MTDPLPDIIARARAKWCSEKMRFDGCLIDLADIYREAFGVDPAQPWRGKYDTEDAMHTLLGRRGVAGAMFRGARLMRWPQINPVDAELGDLGLAVCTDGPACGVICGESGDWLGRIDYGFTVWPTEMDNRRIIRAAWRVSCPQ